MSRHDLTDHEWNAIRRFLPAQNAKRRGRPWKSHRAVINGILWILKTGCPWRDLLEEFGNWKTVFNRFRRWTAEGLWPRILAALMRRLDARATVGRSLWCVDGTIIRAHRSAAGLRKQSPENDAKTALGRSRGGYSTKLHVLTDDTGLILATTATPGQSHESTEFENLMQHSELSIHCVAKRPVAVAGDKAYSSTAIRNWLDQRKVKAIIPTRSNEAANWSFSKPCYRKRNIVERVIGWLKESRRIATRYDKTVESFLAFVQFATVRMMMKRI